MTLDDFLRREASLPPYPGACCAMADKWFKECTGFSALMHFGRTFHNDYDVENWLSEPGGIAVAVNRVMRACGQEKTKEPRIGDVGLALHGDKLCMAILTANGWVSRDENGMICVPKAHFWKAWRVDGAGSI